MKNNQKGFGALGLISVLVIVGLIAAVGWLVYDRQKTPELSSANNTKIDEASQQPTTICGNDWTTIEHTTIEFPEWKTKVSIDDELVAKSACKYEKVSGNSYSISTLDAITEQCTVYYRSLAIADPVVQIHRYLAAQSGLGNLFVDDNDDRTFAQYYESNKKSGTNYVESTAGKQKYYKVGDNFYLQSVSEIFDSVGYDQDKFTPGTQAFKIDETELKKNCPNVKAGFLKQFGDMTAKLKKV